jgi:autotransporter passenger strand-loop-strand repeat protein
MTITVSGGVTSTSLTISSGDPLVVLSGGTVDEVTILDGAMATLSSGGSAITLTVSAGGVVQGPGDVADAEVFGAVSGVADTGSMMIESGGTASGVTVDASAGPFFDNTLQVDSGATATGTVVSDGGEFFVVGSASHAVIEAGGKEVVDAGVATGDTIQSGGGLIVVSGGTVSDETVLSGGVFANDRDVTSNLTLSAATSTTMLDGVTISSGGFIEIESGVVRSGATLRLGGTTSNVFVNVAEGGAVTGPGEIAESEAHGAVSDLTVGTLALGSGGTADGVTIVGRMQIDAGASATGTVVTSGAETFIASGGAATATTVLSGGSEIVFLGGTTTRTQVSAGGRELVSSGGMASSTTISGGLEYVYSGGAASEAVVSDGGKQIVQSGGAASGTTVLGGGAEDILAGGVATGTTVQSGGILVLESGGSASGEMLDDGEVRIAGDATLAGILLGSGAVIETGGGDLVLSSFGDRDFAGKAVIEGGTIELASAGALGSGFVQFVEPTTGSAVLQIDAADAPAAGGTFANTIVDFSGANEDIDLRSIAFVSGASASVSDGVLVLSDGGKTYDFKLAGSVAGLYPVLSDGHGGTLIDPTAARFAQAAAAFAPSHAAMTTSLVSAASPAVQTPFAHATASDATGRA